MTEIPRKMSRSPRAPSMALDEAIERAIKVYEKERNHAAPIDVIAQDIGYKNANNGAALSTLASLRYYGLLERNQQGQLAVSKDLEAYRFAPSESIRRDLLIRWLETPQIFSDLLQKYETGLPSDANLRFELIQRRFTPETANALISVFKRSVQFAGYFEPVQAEEVSGNPISTDSPIGSEKQDYVEERPGSSSPASTVAPDVIIDERNLSLDRIPVRLSGGRRAWLVIPDPFYSADKTRLKAQIDLLLTEDEGDLAGNRAP